MRPLVALVTAREARGLDEDMEPLELALQAAGCDTRIVDWDDPAAAWSAFNAALLRSTWDYTDRLSQFLAWAEDAGRQTRLLNTPAVVRWNTDKHYLAELARAGVSVVPSTFIKPGQQAQPAVELFLTRQHCQEFVVKPVVGAGSRDTQRHPRDLSGPAVAQAQRLLDAGRGVLLQPYLDSVDRSGETALIYIGGQFSHAICKAPLLLSGATSAPAVGLFALERITPRMPGADELRTGAAVLASLPFEIPLYARVDLLRDANESPTLLELELTEPSLFFAHAAGSAERFAAAVVRTLTV